MGFHLLRVFLLIGTGFINCFCSHIISNDYINVTMIPDTQLKIPNLLLPIFNFLPSHEQFMSPSVTNRYQFYCHYSVDNFTEILKIIESNEGFRHFCTAYLNSSVYSSEFFLSIIKPSTLTGIIQFWSLNPEIDSSKILLDYNRLVDLIVTFWKFNLIFPIVEKVQLDKQCEHKLPFKSANQFTDVYHSKYEAIYLALDTFIPATNLIISKKIFSIEYGSKFRPLFPIGISVDLKVVFRFEYFKNPLNMLYFLKKNPSITKITVQLDWIRELLRLICSNQFVFNNLDLNNFVFNYSIEEEKIRDDVGGTIKDPEDIEAFIRANSVLSYILYDSEDSLINSAEKSKNSSQLMVDKDTKYQIIIQVSFHHFPVSINEHYNGRINDKYCREMFEYIYKKLKKYFSRLGLPVEYKGIFN